MKELFRKFYKLLTSTKLTLTVLFILIFFMLLGTLFPQGGTHDEYVKAFGLKMYLRLAPLGVFDIFHSWYFITAAIVLYINLFLCILRGYLIERKKLISFKGKPRGAREITLNVDSSHVEEVLKERRFRYKKVLEDEKGFFLTGVRGIRRRFLSIFFHFFLGISIVGFLLSALTKFDGYIDFEIGDKKLIPRQSGEMGIYKKFRTFNPENVDKIEVELKDYEMEYIWFKDYYYPKDYKSTLIARYKGKEKMRTIEVNSPLRFKGLTLYQSGYGQKFDIEVEDTVVHLSSGSIFNVKGIEGSFKIRTVYVGKLFRDTTVSEIVPNTTIYFREGEDKKWKMLEKLVLDEPIPVMGKNMVLRNVKEESGIYYKRDDGVPLLYVSFLFFMIGLFMRVFFPTYEIRLFYDKNTKSIYVKGSCSGIAAYIEKEIDEIEKMLNLKKNKY